MVTLSLFDTLLALQCEDLMVELLLKFLVPGRHIPSAHRHKVNRTEGYALAIDHFLELAPEVMKLQQSAADGTADGTAAASIAKTSSTTGTGSQATTTTTTIGISKTIGANWNHYGVNNTGDSLYANYRAYLFDARQKISTCQRGCSRWSHNYRLVTTSKTTSADDDQQQLKQRQRSERTLGLIRDFLTEFSDPKEIPTHPAAASSTTTSSAATAAAQPKQLDSLQSLGESSGYESFKYRVDDGDDDSSAEDRSAAANSSSSTTLSTSTADDSGCVPQSDAAHSTLMTLDEHRRKVASWKTSSRRRQRDESDSLTAAGADVPHPDVNSAEGRANLGENTLQNLPKATG